MYISEEFQNWVIWNICVQKKESKIDRSSENIKEDLDFLRRYIATITYVELTGVIEVY